jgi:flagella basal body P-ring formation protein FlgA
MSNGKLLSLVGIVLCMAVSAHADVTLAQKTSIRLQGRADVVVTEPSIRLSDVALIESPAVGDDEAVIELRKISLGQSPRAGETKVIPGVEILEKMRDAGVRLDSLLYTFPRQISVTRAFREVASDELEKALKTYLASSDRHLELRHIVAEKPVRIPADSMGIEVVAVQPIQPGHFGIDYRSRAGSDEVRFQMRAIADEWRVMPVAVRPLKRGEIISAADVRLDKVNATSMSQDSIQEIGDVVGRSLKRDIGEGEMFSSTVVQIPPVVVAGARVTMMYLYGRLQASALGIALESAPEGQMIKVRNDSSQRVVSARVVDKDTVEVGAQ